MHAVVSSLISLSTNKLDLNTSIEDFNDATPQPYLPPDVGCALDPGIGCLIANPRDRNNPTDTIVPIKFNPNADFGLGRGQSLERLILFRYRKILTDESGFKKTATAKLYPIKPYWHKSDPEVGVIDGTIFTAKAAFAPLYYARLYDYRSPLPESLNGTIEVVPNDKVDVRWYRDHWPNLIETQSPNGEIIQHAWQDSDWDQRVPGVVPPIWEMPFGKSIITRKDGESRAQTLRRSATDAGRHIGEFSPMATIQLLQSSCILPSPEVFRSDRSASRSWNDAWGNPLVVSAAMFIAPRYEGHDDYDMNWYGIKDAYDKRYPHLFSDYLKGGRDWLWKKCADSFGSPRQAYICVGAMGPRRVVAGALNDIAATMPNWAGDRPMTTWTSIDDAVVLRAIWLQVRDLCQADRYTADHADKPPWKGVRRVRNGGNISFLCSPVTFP